MYPMKMRPVFRDYLWGGDTLVKRYGKETPLRPVAESWEISCYPQSPSVVANGKFEGMTLPEVLRLYPEAQGEAAGEFPVLIKLIDAKQQLSLQVHPGDEYARRVENQQGKNEMWYVMDAQPGAELILGFKRPVSREEFVRAASSGGILEEVNKVKVKPGDSFSIPAGLLHAIGAGVLIAEVQQSSDVTYRVFDYGRVGADGKKRELHIEKAADVTDSGLKAENRGADEFVERRGYSFKKLTDWEYFETGLMRVDSFAELPYGKNFSCLLVTNGGLSVAGGGVAVALKEGDSAFIPAGLACEVEGRADVLITY